MGYCGYECKCGNIILINNSWENYVCECPECNTEYLCNNGTVLLVQHPKTVYNCNEDMEKEIKYDDTTSKQMLQKKEQVGLILGQHLSKYYIENINDDSKMKNHLPLTDHVLENFNNLQQELSEIIRYENLVKINAEFNLDPVFILEDIHFWVRKINLALEKIRSIQVAVK